jgi:phosphoribosylanthranilate isomerase
VIAPARLPSSNRPWIKVCGVRSLSDLDICASAAASHVGINTWPGSPRSVPPRVATTLLEHARRLGLATVLLHLPGSPVALNAALCLHPDFVQVLHAPSPSLRAALGSEGIGLVESRPARRLGAPALPWGQVLLLDSGVPGRHGGTGTTFDWVLARRAPRPFVLAGGLGPDNVVAAIGTCHPDGVDAASRLESSPGHKDAGRIRAFCEAARAAFKENLHAL